MNIIEQHKDAVIELCKKHHVKTLYVFGSALREDFNEKSDVDFCVLFDRVHLISPEDFGENYIEFILNLESELKREVDVVDGEEIKNPYFALELNRTKKLFYEAA